MKKNNLLIILSITMLALIPFCAVNAAERTGSSTFPMPSSVQTDEMWKPHVGAMLGISSPEGSYDPAASFGLNIGFQPYIPFGLGAELSYSRNEAESGSGYLERTAFLARGTYNFGGTTPIINHSYVGFGLGPVFTESETQLASAPLLGFDIPLTPNQVATKERFASLGASMKYLITEGSSNDELTVNGVVKYWY